MILIFLDLFSNALENEEHFRKSEKVTDFSISNNIVGYLRESVQNVKNQIHNISYHQHTDFQYVYAICMYISKPNI